MFAVSLDNAGWTVVTPAADTRIVYVSSSSGNDASDGLSTNSAVATIAKGRSLLRDGSADWLLLKRGDTFGSFGTWNRRGRSADEPMLLGAYGTGNRPIIDSGTSYGISTVTSSQGTNNIVIQSLDFVPSSYNHFNAGADLAGIRFTARGSNITIEDCRIRGYKDNIVIGGETDVGTVSNVLIRRNVIVDAHADPSIGHAQGIYLGKFAQNVTIEQNILDHNGWRPGVDADRVGYNHNIYSQTNAANVLVRDNVITRASFYGVKFNSGGTITGNFFARNSESVYLERDSLIADNVITEAVDMPGFAGWGVGINTQKTPSATIRHNLITNVLSATASGVAGIQLFNNSTPFSGVIEDNIVYNWRNALLVNTPGNGPDSVVIRNNQFHAVFSETAAADQRSAAVQSALVYENNRYSAGSRTSSANRITGSFQSMSSWTNRTGETGAQYVQPNFPDPSRNIARYNASLGGAANFEDFIADARNMSKANWNAAYVAPAVNQWYWQGFGSTTSTTLTVSAQFRHETLPHKLELNFSHDIGSTLSAADLSIINRNTGAAAGITGISYLPSTRTATISFASALPDGNYRVSLGAGVVGGIVGPVLGSTFTHDFFVLAGDANHDRIVNISDFGIVAAQMNRPGIFSQGDVDYDGMVDINDFALVASRFNRTLPAL